MQQRGAPAPDLSSVATSSPYDLIIVGSGMGALSTASVMAQLRGQRVLVIERHDVLGGFTHTFKRRNGYRWDVGLHYVGGVVQGTPERKVFDFLTGGQLEWQRMAEPFEKFVYPDFTFSVHGDPARYEQDLVDQFPAEGAAIHRYFDDVTKAMKWTVWNAAAGSASWFVRRSVRLGTALWGRIAMQTTAEYLERRFENPQLRAVLASRWGLHGMAPSQGAFGIHAMLARHYRVGGYYPVGGAAQIAKCIVPIVEKQGGAFLTGHEVTRIVLERNRAVGVEVRDRHGATAQIRSRAVVSNVGAYNTYAKLLPPSVGAKHARRLSGLAEQANSTVTVYLGLKGDPRQLGFQGENHWIAESYDHEAHVRSAELLAGDPRWCFVSFPSLNDDQSTAHTANIVAIVRYEDFARWRETTRGKRGPDYDGLKEQMARGLLALVERHYPGFTALVDYQEVSTPLTVEHYVDSHAGAVYGLPGIPARFRERCARTSTPVRNLYLTGADGFLFGIMGAALGGVATAGSLVGNLGFLRLLSAITKAQQPA